MAVNEYNKKKQLEVTSQNDSGTTQDKAQAILVTGGDDSTTGTGDIILDWTNVSSESDIAVYDQNGNLLPYEIESFDATAETATLWCYNSWTRDDTVQAQVVYGDGPSTAEDVVEGVWNNTGQNALMVQHLNDNALDSTSNDNDGTINDATSTTAQIDGGYDFDGTDDNIDFTGISHADGAYTIIGYGKGTAANNGENQRFWHFYENNRILLRYEGGGGGTAYFWPDSCSNPSTVGFTVSDDTYYHWVQAWDGSNAELFKDASSAGSASLSTSCANLGDEDIIGSNQNSNQAFTGIIDDVRVYSDYKSSDWRQADFDATPKAGQVYFSQQAAETTVQEKNETATITTSTANTVTATETSITNETATLTTTIADILTGTETATASETGQITQITANSLTATQTSTANETSTLTQVLTNPLTGTETSSSTESATLTTVTANSLQSTEQGTFQTITDTAQLTTTQAVTVTSTESISTSETANLTTSTTNLLTASETRDAVETATVTQINAEPIQSTSQSTANETAEVTTLTGKLIQAIEERIVNEVAKLTSTTAETLQDDTEAVVNEKSETVTVKANALKQFVDIFGRTKKATLDIKKKTKKTFSGDIDK